MHSFMQIEEFNEEQVSNSQEKVIDNQNIEEKNDGKFENEFCTQLGESLEVLSNVLYEDEEITESPAIPQYAWIPDYTQDININYFENDFSFDDQDEQKGQSNSNQSNVYTTNK